MPKQKTKPVGEKHSSGGDAVFLQVDFERAMTLLGERANQQSGSRNEPKSNKTKAAKKQE